MLHRSGFLAVLFFVAIGCGQSATADRVKALEKKVGELEDDLKTAKETLNVNKIQLDALEDSAAQSEHPKGAAFRPDSKGFEAVYTESGILMVSLKELKPYANGYKAVFDFGNPQSIDFDDVEVELRWGPTRPKDFKGTNYRDWQAQFQETKQKLGKRIRSGSWNPIEVVFSPASPEQIGTIEIKSIRRLPFT